MRTFKRYPNSLWAFRYGFYATSWLSIVSTLLNCLLALLPAINVFAIRALAHSLTSTSAVLLNLLLIGVLFGAGNAIRQVSYSISRINAMRINNVAGEDFNNVLVQSHPTSYESESFMSSVRNARQCITEGQISSQFQAIGNIFDAIITACSLALVIWDISPLSALISVLVPIPTILAYGWYGRQESIFWPQASQCSRRHLYLQDQISYQATGAELAAMKASGRIAALSNRSKNEYLKIREHMEHLSILSNSLCGFATTALFVLALWFLYRDSAHDVSIVFSGIVGLMSGITAMCGIGYQVGELLTSIPANTHLRKFLESAVQSPEYYRPATLDSLEACNLSVFYGRLQAVKDVSLTVSKGQLCALVGENGSGKTSLIKAMMGLQKHASGQLQLGELTLSIENLHTLYPFATVQQDYGRYEISVREFLTLGIPQERQTEENIWHALMFSEADSFVNDLPEKLETQLGTQWGGVNLSGGQWQRLAISRAVLSDAPRSGPLNTAKPASRGRLRFLVN